jgi:hypothetical protein
MGTIIKFIQSGSFNAGEFKSLELEKITDLKIARQRNTCELHAITPENPQPATPYVIARRDKEYLVQEILNDLQKLKRERKEIIYEITDDEVHLLNKV